MSLPYTHSVNACFGFIDGPDKKIADAQLQKLNAARDAMQKREHKMAAALLDLPKEQADLEEIKTLAADIRKNFLHVVIAGSGGSGLSGRMLTRMKPPSSAPVMHFLENIDPDGMEATLARIDVAKTCFIIISKSGATAETLAQFYIFLEQVKKSPEKHFIVITGKEDSPLRRTAAKHGIPVLEHPAHIGGRFSALTNVGLLPAAIAGLDIAGLREGARSVVDTIDSKENIADCAPAMGAAVQYAGIEAGKTISVMLPYSERLAGFSAWYRQSWAESLGKSGKGSTPIRSVGTTDQHSQLQLYLDGPKDKLFNLITIKRAGTGLAIAAPDGPDYLKGKTLGDVMEAEQRATFETLTRNGCPVRVIALSKLGEREMGALLMHFTLEIIFMAHLIGVNPFDQPAVEESKRLAREYLTQGKL